MRILCCYSSLSLFSTRGVVVVLLPMATSAPLLLCGFPEGSKKTTTSVVQIGMKYMFLRREGGRER